MKNLSKKELAKKLPGMKKAYPKQEVFYATEDGNFFLSKRPGENHANTSKLKLFTFGAEPENEDASSDQDDQDQPIKLSKLNKDQLLKLAEEHEIELEGKETNKELVALIEPKLASE